MYKLRLKRPTDRSAHTHPPKNTTYLFKASTEVKYVYQQIPFNNYKKNKLQQFTKTREEMMNNNKWSLTSILK